MNDLRIAFLHLGPLAGDIAYNQALLERAINVAARAGAQWILTPELSTTGYTFSDRIGTEWIAHQPDQWMISRICRMARHYRVVIFLAHVERGEDKTALYNSLFAIGPTGEVLGRHRKINTLRIGSEAWSSPGIKSTVVNLQPYGGIGMLICADACSRRIAEGMMSQGSKFLVSAAAWAPGLHGPAGEWERMTEQTGAPLFVCNRTGEDEIMTFERGESVVVHNGHRLLSMVSPRSAAFLVDWDIAKQRLSSAEPLKLDIPSEGELTARVRRL